MAVSGRTIALPFFGALTECEVDLVGQTLELMIQRQGFGRDSRGGSDVLDQPR